MKRSIFFAALALCCILSLFSGCAGRQTQNETASAAGESRTQTAAAESGETQAEAASSAAAEALPDPAAESELKNLLDPIAGRYGAVGAQAAVIKNGALYACWNYGYADKEAGRAVDSNTKFRCASLSKLTIAMVTAILADEGVLSLDGDVGDCLGYAVRSPSYPDVVITPRMLLTHTASIIDSEAFLSSRNAASSTPLSTLLASSQSYSGARPGSSYNYSNLGAAVMAAAAEQRAGVPFYTLAHEKLFAPLGMDASFLASALRDPAALAALYTGGAVSYSIARQMDERPADGLGQTHHLYQGNLTVSAADYAKLIVTLLNGGCCDGKQILSPAQAQAITGAQFDTGSIADGVQGLGEYQLKNLVGGKTMHCHTGSNFGMYACFAFDMQSKSGVVIFTSGANAAMNYDSGVYNIHTEMVRALYDSILK